MKPPAVTFFSSQTMRTCFFTIMVVTILLPSSGMSAMADSCFACHPKSKFTGATVHRPVAEKKCAACHNPHASRHEGLLPQSADRLCRDCHKGLDRSDASPIVHDPVNRGECLACHEPHASDQKSLLTGRINALCRKCHAVGVERPASSHLDKIACTSCHESHRGKQRALLKSAPVTLCLTCHNNTGSHQNFPQKPQQCMSCHTPHESPRPHLVKAFLHAPYKEGCSSCHPINGSQGASLCLGCHAEVQQAAGLRYTHLTGMGSSNVCIVCHSPHAADSTTMLNAAESSLCLGCHRDTDLRYANRSHRHPRIATCTTCHTIHGSNRIAMLKQDGNAVCEQCHETQGKFTHPVGEGVLDPRNGATITCATCHLSKGTDYPYHLRLPGDKELCVQCHPY